jgi:hypothetical protein
MVIMIAGGRSLEIMRPFRTQLAPRQNKRDTALPAKDRWQENVTEEKVQIRKSAKMLHAT